MRQALLRLPDQDEGDGEVEDEREETDYRFWRECHGWD
jgi:hypothetical protein